MLVSLFFFSTFAVVIKLERHIEILLLSNDCVIVPDFGGFMAHHVDARYDGRDSMFLPPLRTIGFNPQLKINDSLLAQSYVEAYDISYPEALRRIEEEVNEIRQVLENTGKYEFNNIGTIYLNDHGNYSFDPCEAGLLTPSFYGLGGFEIKPLSQLGTSAMTIDMAHESEVNPANSEETSTAEVVSIENNGVNAALYDKEEIEATEADVIQIKKSLLRNMAAACIAVIAFFALSTPLGNSHVQKGQIDTGLLTRIMMPKEISKSSDMAELTLQKENLEKDLASTDKALKVSAQETNELKEAVPYYSIVLASRVTKRNAANYAELLQAKGFKDTRVLITDQNVKVIYGTYATEQEAYSALNKLHNNEVFSDGWITKVKE